MTELKSNICIVLPRAYASPYSQTFVRAHIERLSPIVTYLERFPVDVAGEAPREACDDTAMKLKHTVKMSVHRYLLNPAKKTSLRKFFRMHNVDVVLAEFGVTGVGVLQTCRELNLPLVVHFHGYDAYIRQVLDRYGAAYRKLFAYAHGIIAVSMQMIDQLVQLGAPRQKVFYNPYGVDIAKFKPASLTSRPQALAVGRFVEKKAPYLTILAFQKVLERLPDAKLIMVGDGPLQDVCRQLVRALHIEHAVALKGAVDHEQVAQLMQDSRIFVQHSLVPQSGDSEGTPVGILEAGAAGLPVVSTMHAGIVDTVVHGRTGFLVKEGDIDAMAEYMSQLLINPELALDMGKSAREHISRNFNMEDSISNLRAIIDKCAGRELAPRPAQVSAIQSA